MPGRGRQPDRFLATILFTDIVGSTDIAAEVGDREWRRTVARHHAAVREQLRRFDGHEIDTAGDGFFAQFAQPAQAVRAADAIIDATRRLGLQLRIGVHTGECERVGGKVGGIAVHIAARVMATAEAGEVIVSSTVRDLVQGSGLAFEDRGARELKGVPGEWRLFSLVRAAPAVGVDDAASGRATVGDERLDRNGELSGGTRRRRLAVVALGVLILGAAAALVGFGVLNGGPTAVMAVPGPNSVATINRSSGAVTDVEAVPAGPVALAIANGRIWTGSLDAAVVTSMSTTGARDTQTIGRVGQPTGIAIGNGAIWIADALGKGLALVDPTSGDVTRTIESLNARRIAYGFDAAWVTDDINDAVTRLDRQTSDTVATIPVGKDTFPTALAIATDSVWVGNAGTSTLARIDPSTNTIVAGAIPLRGTPTALAAGANDVWVISRDADLLQRVDPDTNAVAATNNVGDQPTAVAADGEGVWVGLAGTHELVHYDRDFTELSRTALAGQPTAIATDGDNVYVAVREP